MTTATIETDARVCAVCTGRFAQRDVAGDDICNDCFDTHSLCFDCGGWFNFNDLRHDMCPTCSVGRIGHRASKGGPNGVSWADWAEIADLASEVDFGCDFDCNGKCKSIRRGDFNCKGGHKACCVECAGNIGYLEEVPDDAVETIEALFDDNDGFWHPDGCALPHAWRSSICLGHYCSRPDKVGSKLGENAWYAFDDLVNGRGDRRVAQVRALLRNAGLLRTEQLVTIS